jgi:hypothetical protein
MMGGMPEAIFLRPLTVDERATLEAGVRSPDAFVMRRCQILLANGRAERLRALLHQSPRTFGRPTSLWTLDWVAEVAYAQGITPEQVSGETVRATRARLGIGWQRAKEWITSPDPEYARKETRARD